MKIFDKFKDRKFVAVFIAIISVVIIAVSVFSIMIPSYLSYKEYYDKAVWEREEQKRINKLPLEFLGITATLADGVTYYDNGKASPKRDDFNVMAHFTEKGKNFDELLRSDSFEIIVPNDFAENGGTVTVNYTWTPENGSDEAAPVTKTAKVPISLEAVRLESLVMTEQPYRVYYANDMAFDPEGMSAEARYNDGTTVALSAEELRAPSGTLTSGTEEVDVSWSDGSDEVSAPVPVTVVDAASYDDGNILSINGEGEVYLNEGAPLSSAQPVVRATYASGNRLIPDGVYSDMFDVEGNIENASFMKNCILTVSLKESESVSCRVAAKVRNGIEAEDADHEGGSEVTVSGSSYDADGAIVADEAQTTAVEGASSISFVCADNSGLAKTNLTMRVANRTEDNNGEIASVTLASVASLTVNGKYIPIDRSIVLGGQNAEEAEDYVFTDVTLPDIVLNDTPNTIVLTFKTDAATLAVDRIDLSTKYEGTLYSSVRESIAAGATAGIASELGTSMAKEWYTVTAPNTDFDATYAYGMTTDGIYLYIVHTRYVSGGGLREAVVERYDPESGESVVCKATAPCITEEYGGISYYDGKIILLCEDGTRLATETSSFGADSEFTAYDGYAFDGLEAQALLDVTYSEKNDMFAVWSGSNVWLYNANGDLVKSFAPAADTAGGIKRMTADDEYIYLNYSATGTYTPVLHVYDWSGNYIGRTLVPCTFADLGGSSAVSNAGNVNTQGIVCLGGEMYFSVVKFNPGDSGAIMKAGLTSAEADRELSLNFGEYIAACADGSYSPDFAVSQAAGSESYGLVDGVNKGYAMGGVSDGTYIYMAYNPNKDFGSGSVNIGNNQSTVIYKIDPETCEVVAYSSAFSTHSPTDGSGAEVRNGGDNSQLMIKNDTLYCFVFGSRVYSIDLSLFAQDCVLRETTLPFGAVTDGGNSVKGAYWNEQAGRYAVLDYASGLYVLDESGDTICDRISLRNPSGMTAASVTGDDKYIYVAYHQNGQKSVPFDIYTWDGVYVGSGTPDGISLKINNGNYNVQAIFFHDGEMYTTFCAWSGSSGAGLYLWNMEADLGVFNVPTAISVEYTGKTEYSVGEAFDRNALTVTVTYSDGSSKVVTDYNVAPGSFTQAGNDMTVTISYTDKGRTVSDMSVKVNVKGISQSLGDYISGDGQSVSSAIANGGQAISSPSEVIRKNGEFGMGGVSYGGYLYVCTVYHTGDRVPAYVYKMDPATFEVVAYERINDGSGDLGKVFTDGTNIYCILDKGIHYVSLEMFGTGSCENFSLAEDGSLPFTETISAAYDDAHGYASLNENDLTLYDKSGSRTKTVDLGLLNTNGATSGMTAKSVTCDGDYIYVVYSANNQRTVPVVVLDWEGNYVGVCAPQSPGTPSTNFNVQAIFTHNDVTYAVVCAWGSTDGVSGLLWLWTLTPAA